MSRKQGYRREVRLLLPPSPPPRNPFANAAKMRHGVDVHEKSQGALRRGLRMKLARAAKGDFSVFEN
jgi:hypothetical protein